MGGYIDTASRVIALATQRIEVAASNVSNIDTAGYKRELSFSSVLDAGGKDKSSATALDMSSGKVVTTGQPYDLAILGDGFFVVASSDGTFYTRGGQFQRDADGRLLNLDGLALQSQDGGDVTLRSTKPPKILQDGTVLEDGQPVAKIAVVSLGDGAGATYVKGGVISAAGASDPIDAPAIQQGAYESSNVSTGDEMISMMLALRQAETAQKLVNVYDDLTGRVIDAFSQAGGG